MREIGFKAVIAREDGSNFVTPVLNWVDFAGKLCGFTTHSGGTDEYEEHEEEYIRILQNTGLQDKNGVEIFDGDIVLYNTTTNIETCVIRYSQGCSYLAYPVQFPNCAGYRLARDIIGMREYSEKTGKVEVIDNIYEHPELLERSKS